MRQPTVAVAQHNNEHSVGATHVFNGGELELCLERV